MQEQLNLVLVYVPSAVDVDDYNKIRHHVNLHYKNINVVIHQDTLPDPDLVDELSKRLTFVFSPMQLKAFYVKRGRVYAGRPMLKSEQLLRLELAGVPVPEWTSLDRGKKFDPGYWGEFVVVKPEVGSGARGVVVRRTEWLNEVTKDLVPFSRTSQNYIVQKLVRSVEFSKIRVQTLFDEVLYACQYRFRNEIKFDTEQDVANFEQQFDSFENQREYCYREDIFDLARKCFKAFDGAPLLGLDVMIDESGVAFFLEANPGGNTWHYSSKHSGQRLRNQGFVLEEQFGAFERAGDELARHTLTEAI
jgi:hypothetical protein